MGDKNITFVDRGRVRGTKVNDTEVPRYNNCNATYETVMHMINVSNTIACVNPNKYPIQEQASLLEIWEQVPRELGHELPVEHTDYVYVLRSGLELVYVLRSGLEFEDVSDAYIRTLGNMQKRLLTIDKK